MDYNNSMLVDKTDTKRPPIGGLLVSVLFSVMLLYELHDGQFL